MTMLRKLTLTIFALVLLMIMAPALIVGQTKTDRARSVNITTCTLGTRVAINCKTAIKCEQSIGKADQYDNMLKQAQTLEKQRDNADGMLVQCRRDRTADRSKDQKQTTTIAMLRQDNQRLRQKQAKQWSPWTWVGIGAGAALVGRWLLITLVFDSKGV